MRKKNYFGLIPSFFFRSFDDVFNHDFSEEKSSIDFEKYTSENEGRLEITTGENENGTWEKKEWTSNDGAMKMSTYVMTSNNFGKPVSSREDLKKQLRSAIESEDYELAAKLKKQIDSI